MSDELLIDIAEPVAPPSGNGVPPPEPWQVDKNGKEWVPREGKRGKLFRQAGETVAQARERDKIPLEERRPRRKPKMPPKPAAAAKPDLKALEVVLAQALSAPGIVCATFGDEWAAEHFRQAGPFLARNLINAAEHNPWLRRKLEEAASGEDAMMKLVGVIGIGGGLAMYFVPPTIYFLNLPVPEKTRELFHVPPRREPEPDYADPAPPDQGPPGPFRPTVAA